MADRGFAGASNFEFDLAPVHPWGNDDFEVADREARDTRKRKGDGCGRCGSSDWRAA